MTIHRGKRTTGGTNSGENALPSLLPRSWLKQACKRLHQLGPECVKLYLSQEEVVYGTLREGFSAPMPEAVNLLGSCASWKSLAIKRQVLLATPDLHAFEGQVTFPDACSLYCPRTLLNSKQLSKRSAGRELDSPLSLPFHAGSITV